MFYLILMMSVVLTTFACTDRVKPAKVVDVSHVYSPATKKACNKIKAASHDPKKYDFRGCMRELDSLRDQLEDILSDPRNLKETSN